MVKKYISKGERKDRKQIREFTNSSIGDTSELEIDLRALVNNLDPAVKGHVPHKGTTMKYLILRYDER